MTFETPVIQNWTDIFDILETSRSRIPKSTLQYLFINYLNPFYNRYYNSFSNDMRLTRVAIDMTTAKDPDCSDILKSYALILAGRDILQTFLLQLPSKERHLFLEVIRRGSVDLHALSTEFGLDMKGETDLLYDNGSKSVLCLFVKQMFLNRDLWVFMEPDLRGYLLLNALPIEEITPEGLDSVSSELMIYEGEKQIFQDLALLEGFREQGNLIVSPDGKVGISVIRKAVKMLGINGFDDVDRQDLIRPMLLILYYGLYRLQGDKDQDQADQIRQITMSLFPKSVLRHLPILYSHIKGLRRLEQLENYLPECFDRFRELAREIEPGKWYGTDAIWNFMEITGRLLSPLTTDYLSWEVSLSFRESRLPVETFDYLSLSRLFWKIQLAVWGAFGLVDLAFREERASDDLPYERIESFRFTTLGLFCFGLTDHYETEKQDKQLFEVETDRLYIRSLEPGNPYEKLLADVSIELGNDRYKITPLSFLRGCKSPLEIENKVQFFREYVCPKPPAIWEEFFKALRLRIKPLTPLPDTVVFALDPDNQELIRLFAHEPSLRKLVCIGEGYTLIVSKKQVSLLRKQLKSFGYLL